MKMNRRRLLSGGLSIGAVLALASMGVTIPEAKANDIHETALEKVNNRRLLNYIHNIMDDAMQHALFEINDTQTRDMVIKLIHPRLVNLQKAGAMQECMVVCNDTNNTDKVISENSLVVDIYVILNNMRTVTNIRGTFAPAGMTFDVGQA